MQVSGNVQELVGQYVDHKRALGYAYGHGMVTALRRMAGYLDERRGPNGEFATQEAVMDWIANGGSDHPTTRSHRGADARLFCAYLANRGYDVYVLPADLIPPAGKDFVPYIFTRGEIEKLVDIVDQLGPARCSPYRGLMHSAMVRILYGCGLRLSEMLKLEMRDVDLEGGVLAIRNSKNDDSRYVPMSESLRDHLACYVKNGPADESDPSSYLFPSPRGGHYDKSIIGKTLKRCFASAGVENRDGKPPRVHDLRHTFAVHSLLQAAERGIPAHVFLPALATYMGHKDVAHTERYLHLTAEGQDAMIDKLAAAYGDRIYKEVR